MKKLILFFTILLPVLANAEYLSKTALSDLPYGATNSFIIDATESSSFSLSVLFSGAGDHAVTTLLGITNPPPQSAALGITLGGATTVYTWTTNAVQNFTTNYSGSGTNLIIGFTAGTTNSAAVSVILNGATNTFSFSNSPSATTDVLTNTTANGSATNFALIAGGFYPFVTVSANLVTIASGVSGSISSTTSTVATNNTLIYYTVTNLVATNSHQIAVGATAAISTTNLAAKLMADYPLNLSVGYSTATLLSLATFGNPGFTLTNSTLWATNLITTNAISGGIVFLASNSLDKVTWFPDAAKNFTLNYNSTSPVGCLSNWISIGSIGYWQFTAQNAAANFAVPQGLQVKLSVKKGF